MKAHLICISILLTLLFSQCKERNPISFQDRIGFEKTTNNDKKFLSDKRLEVEGRWQQNQSYFFEGEHSMLMNSKNQFGGKYIFKNVQPGQYIRISAWRKSNSDSSLLVLREKTPGYFYIESNHVVEEKNGWKKINIETIVPYGLMDNTILFYIWCKDKKEAFFDAVNIEVLKQLPLSKVPAVETLSISLSEAHFSRTKSIRNRAIKEGILDSKKNDYVNGIIQYKGNIDSIKLRLKGDWTDHFQLKKWSYRIKLKNGNTWNGFKKFSIQSPKTRNYMSEWVIHQLYEHEQLLTTTFDFIPIKFNGLYYGIYSFEEHFEKELLTSRGRKNGPIFKFYENDLFNHYRLNLNTKSNDHPPLIEASDIICYHQNKYLKRDSGKLFYEGQKLMYELRWGTKPIDSIINIKSCAKTYALNALTQTYHGLHWHNQRFYLDPETHKLEWINYDAENGYGTSNRYVSGIFFGSFYPSDKNYKDNLASYHLKLFKSKPFIEEYIKYLELYSSEAFLKHFINSISPNFQAKIQLLKTDYPSYDYDINVLHKNARLIRKKLVHFKKEVSKQAYKEIINRFRFYDKIENLPHPYPQYLLKAHQESSSQLSILSFMDHECSIVGYTNKINTIEYKLEIAIPAYLRNHPPKPINLPYNQKWTYVVYKANEVVYYTKIYKWKAPVLN